jgi:hypothetical protein
MSFWKFNISSLFLCLPLLFISDLVEIIGVTSIAIVSWCYHTNRELDRTTGFLQPYTIKLYNIDRTQVQLGFTYTLIKYINTIYKLSLYEQVPIYLFSLYHSHDTDILISLVSANIMMAFYWNPINCLIILGGFVVGYSGYNPMPNDNNTPITKWPEINKCVWHAGMSLSATGLLMSK